MDAYFRGLAVVLLLASAAADAGEPIGDDGPAPDSPTFRSPGFLAVSPDGNEIFVCDQTKQEIAVFAAATRKKTSSISLPGQPAGLCLSRDGRQLFVAIPLRGVVVVIDTGQLAITRQMVVGHYPVAISLADEAGRLFVAHQFLDCVGVIDLNRSPPEVIERIPVSREPTAMCLTADATQLVVSNMLPRGAATDATLGAVITLIDTTTLETTSVSLPPGSTVARGVTTSPDCKWAYVVHDIGRFQMPITQLERGWVNTTALSILDLEKQERHATVLLDRLTKGAADPIDVSCSLDGRQLAISHAGTHEVSLLNIGKLHHLLVGQVSKELEALKDGSSANIWAKIQQDPAYLADLQNDLTALYIADVVERVESGGNCPHGVVISPDGRHIYVANRLSGTVGVIDAKSAELLTTLSLGPQPPETAERRGELVFHDAGKSFQSWFSCATCHPNGGRVDGLRWDFLRDGIGNAKDTIDLVGLNDTAPYNRRATRKTARECAETGLSSGHMVEPSDDEVTDLLAYLVSLRPVPSPLLTTDGRLTMAAERGRALFMGETRCAECHPPPLFTDLKMHDIGTQSPTDPNGRYDTPALVEIYRTGAYLHDGRAVSIRDVLTTHNPHDKHGKTQQLSAQEIEDLAAFVLSL